MTFESMSDKELLNLRDLLQKDLQRLRASKKNLNNTIRNITNDMQQHYTKPGSAPIINGGELPRA